MASSDAKQKKFSGARLRLWSWKSWLTLVVVVVVSFTTFIVAIVSSDGFANAAPAPAHRLALSQVKDINYMPVDASWENMWTKWHPGQIAQDYRHISALGVNTVRIIVSMPAFNFPTPTKVMAARLAELISTARASGLHVQLTLFDGWGLYQQIPQSTEFINNLMAPYRNDPEIAFVELQNEINLATPGALAWARAEIPVLKAAAGAIPVTISTSGSAGLAGLAELKAGLSATPPDFYDFHFYGSAGSAYAVFAAAKRIASPSRLIIGEVGFATPANTPTLQSQQANFYTLVDAATSDLGLPAAAPWTMFDLARADAPGRKDAQALDGGLFRTNRTAKPAAGIEHTFLSTGRIEGTVMNANFESSSGGGLPTGWVTSHAAGAEMARSTVSQTGGYSVMISRAGGTSSAVPRWETAANLGAITPGEAVSVSVWASGVKTTGWSALSLSWFSATNGYLGNTTSPSVPSGTSGWAQLHVSSAAPSGAAYAMVNLESYKNSGTVYFDGVTLTK